jgi:hypothetical protein
MWCAYTCVSLLLLSELLLELLLLLRIDAAAVPAVADRFAGVASPRPLALYLLLAPLDPAAVTAPAAAVAAMPGAAAVWT